MHFSAEETSTIMTAAPNVAFLTVSYSNIAQMDSIGKCVGLLILAKITTDMDIQKAEKLALKFRTPKQFIYIAKRNSIRDLLWKVKNSIEAFDFKAGILEIDTRQGKGITGDILLQKDIL
jgi:hypothetical protein